jgi:hypothetical protein
MMRGETIVWDGRKIVRYPRSMKDQARARYKSTYDQIGLDFDKILEDDPKEVSKLAVWSYQQLELRLSMGNPYEEISYTNDDNEGVGNTENTPSVSVNKPIGMRNPEPRNADETVALPVFGYQFKEVVETENGVSVVKEVPVVQSQMSSMRQCNTCYIATNCPAYKQDSMCAFNLPIEVKTKEQLKGLINAVIEMQGQRVAFMRFAEEMNGGYADPNVSQEIDRLFKLIKTTKELDDSREFIRMTVERQGSAGVLSSIFGEKANVLKEIPNGGLNEDQTTQIIKGAIEE